MALSNPLDPFIWGAGGAQLTPEQIARQRQIADALLQQGMDFSPIASPWQGLARVANAAVGGIKDYRADKADRANADASQSLIAKLLSGGNEQFPAAPGSSDTSSPTAYEPNGNEVRDGIISTANALGIDPVDLGTAISYETAGTFDPTKTGPTTQWGQHKGLIQFGEPQAKQFGVDWNNPIGSQLGPDGAVAKYLQSTGVKPGMGLLDIYSAINAGGVGRYGASDANNGGAPGTVRDKVEKQMAGHRAKALALLGDASQPAVAAVNSLANGGVTDDLINRPEMAQSAQVSDLVQRPGMADDYSVQQVASLDPSIGMAQTRQVQLSPGQPVASSPEAQRVIEALTSPQSMTGGAPMGMMAQAAPEQDLSRIPVTAGGNAGVYQPGQSTGINPAVIEALSSPYASPQVQKIAGLLLQQQMQQNDPMRMLEMRYKQAQIDKLTDPNARDKFGNSVIWGQNADGDWVAMQPSSGGGLVAAQVPDGIKLSPPGMSNLNLGTEFGMRDRNGQVINTVPIDNAGKAAATAAGKAQGEAAFDLPRVEQNAEQTLDVLERMKTHPGREGSTGFIEGLLPSRTSDQVDFQSLVDQTQGQSFLQAFQMLKGAGQITDIEGKKATDAISRLRNQRLSDDDYLRAINDLEDVVRTGLARARVQAGQGNSPAPSGGSQKRLKFNPATGELE